MAKREPLKNIAYHTLKNKILNNEFPPNTYLEEKALCELLNISRTPIREAINKLEFENLVQIIPQKGIFVTDFTIQSVAELFQARKLVEPLLLQLSGPVLNKDTLLEFRELTLAAIEANDIDQLCQIDCRLHNYFNSNCQNQFLTKLVAYITDQYQRVRTQNFYPQERTLQGAKEHIDMIDQLINDDFNTAQESLRKHIANTESYYFKNLLKSATTPQTKSSETFSSPI